MEIRQTEPVKNVPWKSVQCVQKMGPFALFVLMDGICRATSVKNSPQQK